MNIVAVEILQEFSRVLEQVPRWGTASGSLGGWSKGSGSKSVGGGSSGHGGYTGPCWRRVERRRRPGPRGI